MNSFARCRRAVAGRPIAVALMLTLLFTLLPSATQAAPMPQLIRLRYATFDPLQAEPPQEQGIDVTTAPDQSNTERLYIVQFSGPILSTWRSSVEATGATVLGYIPDHAYLVMMRGATSASLAQQPYVRWVGKYRASYKLDPALLSAIRRSPASTQPRLLSIIPRAGVDANALATRLKNKTGTQIQAAPKRLSVNGDLAAAITIARDDDILWIEPWHQMKLLNKDAAWVVQSGTAGDYPVWADGITGAGPAPRADGTLGTEQLIAIGDTGIDMHHIDFQGPEFPNATVFQVQNYGDLPTGIDCHGHGSHVAGTAAGSGAASGGDSVYNNGSYKGIAYGARIYFQQLCTQSDPLGYLDTGTNPAPFTTILQDAYNAGARIHSDSWGDNTVFSYDSWAQAADDFMWNHPDFLITVAAGNYYNPNTITSPATAKNVVTVGSVGDGSGENYRSGFSSQGPVTPASDGRVKPDLLAPGSGVTSVANGTTNQYIQMSGTSMATPATAGAAALLRDWFQHRRFVASPSAALIKATLMLSGRYLATTGDTLPSNAQGWGRVTLADLLYPSAPVTFKWQDITNAGGITTGQVQEYDYYAGSSGQPLKVMLDWTDAPGSLAAAKALVNDLDLVVIAPDGTTYNGNAFSGAFSVPGGSNDRLNNAEGVYIANPQPGTYRVLVRGYEVPQGPQGYALTVLLPLNAPYLTGGYLPYGTRAGPSGW